MSEKQWYVRRGQDELGPLTHQQIQLLVEIGDLSASDLVRTSDSLGWQDANTFQSLFASGVPSQASSSGYDIEDMLDVWMELNEDNPYSTPTPESIWPNCPSKIIDELRARLAYIVDVHGLFSPHKDIQMADPDLSLLQKGYRPTTSSYVLTEPLGEGGCGAVWKAENPKTGKTVAFKFSILLGEEVDPLDNEFSKIKELDHPGIVKLQEEHPHAPIPCLVYEYIDGMDLREFLVKHFKFLTPESIGGERCTLNPNHAAGVILKLTEIMAYVHNRPTPIVHRDLKPANILLSNHLDLAVLSALDIEPDLRLAMLKVMDFGLAGRFRPEGRDSSESVSIGKHFLGWRTNAYASPQQKKGEPAHPADDVFAIGVIWYELLRGRIGLGAPSGMRWHDELRSNGLSDEQLKVLVDCLEEERDHRIQNAVELVKHIRAVYSLEPPVGVFEQVKDAIGRGVRFEKVTSLSVEMAKFLMEEVSSKDDDLNLSGLLSLPTNVAKALVSKLNVGEREDFCVSRIYLDGLAELSVEVAKELSKGHWDFISLDGLKELSSDVAEIVATSETYCEWSFCGLKTLCPQTARLFSGGSGGVVLGGLTSLTTEAALALGHLLGEQQWYLDGLRTLPPEMAVSLMAAYDCLSFDNVTDISTEVARVLSSCKELSLCGLKTLSPEVASALANVKDILSLSGLASLTPDTAAALSTFTGHLDLYGLETLTPEVSRIIPTWKAQSLNISGMSLLTPEMAKGIAQWQGQELHLGGIFGRRISAICEDEHDEDLECWKALASWNGHSLYLGGLTDLTKEIAQALASWRGESLNLMGVESLSVEAAECLARWKGTSLSLDGLESLPQEIAQALATSKADRLSFDNVQELLPAAAQALATWRGERLALCGAVKLSTDAGRKLCNWQGKSLFLWDLTLSPQDRTVLAGTVQDLELSVRARKILDRHGITSLIELVQRTPQELLAMTYMSMVTLHEIQGTMLTLNLKLRND